MGRPAALRWTLPLAIAVLAACVGGGGEESSLDAATFQEAYDQLGTMIDRARADDVDGAEEAFAQVRGLTRLVDASLAARPQEVIARAELFDALTRVAQELAERRRPDFLADYAEDTRRALAQAAEALGFERPQD